MYYDPSVQIDTPEFYMYAALAGCVLMLFVFFPIVLLILVPDETFYKLRLMLCISQVACSARLLNHFRDSTKSTRDYRVVSASFLIIRLVYIAILISGTASELCCVLFACTFYLHAIIRPYKLHYRIRSFNLADILVLILLQHSFLQHILSNFIF